MKSGDDETELTAIVEMCYDCFNIIITELASSKLSDGFCERMSVNRKNLKSLVKNSKCPMFITWNKLAKPNRNNDDYNLRGCIGTLSPQPVMKAMSELAISAAFHDRRFQPIQLKEVNLLSVGVSLLVQYETCEDCFDWTVGVHGIMINFQGHYSATYLPEVAKEQHWTRKEAVDSLIRKAGYNGQIDKNLYARISCTRYQSSKVSVTYDEYVSSHHKGSDPLHEISKSKKGEKKVFGLF